MGERQLTLDLRTPPALGRADFLPAPANAEALALIDRPGEWPQGRLLLVGPDGSGKSHMAAFWAAENGAMRVAAPALRPDSADVLVAPGGALVIENAHRAGGAAGAERALFHIWNLSAERDCLLLLTARTPPRDWGLSLPDLASRMAAMPLVRLGTPDEALLAAVLVKLFADRQLTPGTGVVEALVRRMDRDLGLARRLVAEIDRHALAEGRAVTRPLALAALSALTGTEGDETLDEEDGGDEDLAAGGPAVAEPRPPTLAEAGMADASSAAAPADGDGTGGTGQDALPLDDAAAAGGEDEDPPFPHFDSDTDDSDEPQLGDDAADPPAAHSQCPDWPPEAADALATAVTAARAAGSQEA